MVKVNVCCAFLCMLVSDRVRVRVSVCLMPSVIAF